MDNKEAVLNDFLRHKGWPSHLLQYLWWERRRALAKVQCLLSEPVKLYRGPTCLFYRSVTWNSSMLRSISRGSIVRRGGGDSVVHQNGNSGSTPVPKKLTPSCNSLHCLLVLRTNCREYLLGCCWCELVGLIQRQPELAHPCWICAEQAIPADFPNDLAGSETSGEIIDGSWVTAEYWKLNVSRVRLFFGFDSVCLLSLINSFVRPCSKSKILLSQKSLWQGLCKLSGFIPKNGRTDFLG